MTKEGSYICGKLVNIGCKVYIFSFQTLIPSRMMQYQFLGRLHNNRINTRPLYKYLRYQYISYIYSYTKKILLSLKPHECVEALFGTSACVSRCIINLPKLPCKIYQKMQLYILQAKAVKSRDICLQRHSLLVVFTEVINSRRKSISL